MPKIGSTAWRISMTGLAVAIPTFFLSTKLSQHLFSSETYVDDALLAMVVAAITIAFLCQKELRKRAVAEQRLRAFRATMVTVHDILGNFLNCMQLIRLDAEESLPHESIQLFDQVIADVQTHLKALSDLDILEERQMAIGMGIDYRVPSSPTFTVAKVDA